MDKYSEIEHFKTISAVLVAIIDNGKILLQKRNSTGFADGMWDFSVSGHVEDGEPMSKTVFREAKEEIGIDVDEIKFVGLMHNLGDDGVSRYLGIFKVIKYSGEPKICEPEKCSELKWFDLDDLPENIIDTRKQAIKYINSANNGFYQEYGWD